ncbi:MAG: DUF5667 domain-containing protein [Candidatus Paceibacterota bacterium]
MKNEEIQIGINKIQNIKMTTEEKKLVLENILTSPIAIKKSIPSPYSFQSFVSILQRNHFAYYSMATFLIIVLSSGGIALASQESLPGNILYPIKVSIIEPINSALKFSTEAKAKYESSLATERLIEAETLASRGKLDTSKEKQINDLLAIHTTALDEAINKLHKEDQSSEKAYEIATNFKAEMSAHAQILDIINEQNNTNVGVSTSINLEKQQTEDTQISATARINANKIKVFSKENNKNVVKETQNEYVKKKQSVETMISSTASTLNQSTATSSSTSTIKQKIIDNTRETLETSNQFLNNANEQNEKGNEEDAYSSLLDSESRAKEANIFLERGLQLEEENNP